MEERTALRNWGLWTVDRRVGGQENVIWAGASWENISCVGGSAILKLLCARIEQTNKFIGDNKNRGFSMVEK